MEWKEVRQKGNDGGSMRGRRGKVDTAGKHGTQGKGKPEGRRAKGQRAKDEEGEAGVRQGQGWAT